MQLANADKIGLSMAVFLANDDYDYDPRPNSISATGILKSPRQAILIKRATKLLVEGTEIPDISTFVASRFGSAIHDGIERAWTNKRYVTAMLKLGYSEQVIDRILVNPSPADLAAATNPIPVYMEKRSEKAVGNYIVRGKFDFVGDGELEDHKTTGVFTYMKGTNNDKFRQQGSIYRWLNPGIITSDRMLINYTFTDWSKLRSMVEANKGYPPKRMMSVPLTLMTLPDTEKFVTDRLKAIEFNINKPEAQLPLCTKEDLWQDKTTYKYYKNPQSKARSTKNFDTFAEAQTRMIKDGNVGVIDIAPGMAKHCLYCSGAPICSQAKQLVADGLLDMEL